MSGFAQLADALRAEGGLLADTLAPTAVVDPYVDDTDATGERALVLAAVREGYLLHYGAARLVRTDDADLALLGGDRLYALGLARLADLGDLDAVAALAELISRCARAHAEDDPAQAEAAWKATAAAIGRDGAAGG
jgi:hypothetical protein